MDPRVDEKIQSGNRITLIGVLVNGLLICIKVVGGIFGHSQALLADAVHSLSDFLTDGVVLVGLALSGKEPDDRHHFGHARMETLASAIIGLVLMGAGVGLGYDAGWRIYHRQGSNPTWPAVLVAVASVLAKELLYRYTIRVAEDIKSQAVKANAWHHRSDALSSVAVLIGVIAIQIEPTWMVLDAYAALLVSIFILKSGFDILLESTREFTDAAPADHVIEDITECALKVQGVQDVHDLKARTTGGFYQMELHVVVDGALSVREGHRIAKEVESCLLKDIDNLQRIIIHVDPDEDHPE